MEIKKSPKADLENKRGLFLEIGLVVALVLVIGAFAVTPKEQDRKSTRLNSSHSRKSRMPSSA